jgi:hypothetical protein
MQMIGKLCKPIWNRTNESKTSLQVRLTSTAGRHAVSSRSLKRIETRLPAIQDNGRSIDEENKYPLASTDVTIPQGCGQNSKSNDLKSDGTLL